VVSVWCGLVSGLLEVGITILRKRALDSNHLYWMSRHFLWLVPLANLLIFLGVGVLIGLAIRWGGRRGRWLAPRLLCTMAWLPPLWTAFPRIYGPAGFLLAAGLAARLVPALERRAAGFRRVVRVSFPVAAGLVPALAAGLSGADRLEAWREQARPLPPAGSPNVLLIVLDTVAADHLGLYGYPRPTSPTLEELASRGIRFDRAEATSSWTLPSHGSMFTGRWPHELSAGWLTPLDGTYPTLAEFLGSRGYATAGFAANYAYCASDSGLSRGFATYRDYIFPRLTALGKTTLVDRSLAGLQSIARWLEDRLDFDGLRPISDLLWWSLKDDRKNAAVVNRELLDWLSRRRQPERPFFAFLNYYDAHYPYELPELGMRRFLPEPRDAREANLIRNWLTQLHLGPSTRQIGLIRDAYDDCVAGLDEQLGCLIDELEHRAVGQRTWVIIAADHGESFGEHPGVFGHGMSLYQTELHVPLLIVPPATGPAPRAVTETVSLRDLAATIVDVLGLQADSPFPGESLARLWGASMPTVSAQPGAAGRLALSEVVPRDTYQIDPSQWLGKPRWPMAALTAGDWTYIRRAGDVREELFDLRWDAQQRHNRAGEAALKPVLERMRATLDRRAGPLTPERFNP
jgi:arylsulfatase A-like enzyme